MGGKLLHLGCLICRLLKSFWILLEVLQQLMSQALPGTYWRENVYRGGRNIPLWVGLQVSQFSDTIQYLQYGSTLQWRLFKHPGPYSKKVFPSVTNANFRFRVSNLELVILFSVNDCQAICFASHTHHITPFRSGFVSSGPNTSSGLLYMFPLWNRFEDPSNQ